MNCFGNHSKNRGNQIQTPRPRLGSIDTYRGLAILAMVWANYLAGISWIPGFIKHAPDIGSTAIDLVALPVIPAWYSRAPVCSGY